MPYGKNYYGERLYGEESYNPNIIWAIKVDWNGDGYYDGYNEAWRCVGLSIRRGRELPVESGQGFEHAMIGEARIILDNYDDRYNYYNTSSVYYPNVKQGKYIQICILNGSLGTPEAIFTGTIEDIELSGAGTSGGTATITCKDGWNFLKNKKTNINVSSSYKTGTAIAAILADVGWPSIWGSSIDSGIDSLDYFWATNKNARDAIDELNDSEFGIVRIAGDGKFEFYERGHEPSANVSISQSDLNTKISLPAPWKTTRNKAIVHVYPRKLQEDVIMFNMTDTPSIEPDKTLVVWSDLNYEGRSVASNSITQPTSPNIYKDIKTIAFVSATKKITDSANGLIGFTTGMKIYVSGAKDPANNGTFTVATGGVAGEIVVSETLVDEAAGSSITIDQAKSTYTANSEAGGGGSDMTASAVVTAVLFGSRVKNSIKNIHATNTLYVTEYRIVGDAIDCPNESTVEFDNSGTEEETIFELDVPWLTVSKYASNYATFLGTYLNTTHPFPIIKMEDRPEIQFSGELFDRFGLSLAKFGIDAYDYQICMIEHNWIIDNNGQSVETTWYTERRSAAASGGDVMQNGDFEHGDLSHWTQSGLSMAINDDYPYEGAHCLKIDVIPSGTKTLTSDRVAAIEDQTYRISLVTRDTFVPPDLHNLTCAVTDICYIDSANPTVNYNGGNVIGGLIGGAAYRALMNFDFSAIPADSKIVLAALKNTLTAKDSSVLTNATIFRCTKTWDKTTVTWNTKPDIEPTGIGGISLLPTEPLGIKSINIVGQYMNEIKDTAYNWINTGFMIVASPEGGTVSTTTTTWWKETYFLYYILRVEEHGKVGTVYRWYPVYGYRWHSTTTTTSSSVSNKYTFSNTPSIDLTYDTVTYPYPEYEISIKWYDAASAGNLLRTDVIGSENKQVEWNTRTIQVNSPVGALSFEILITATQSNAVAYIDDIIVVPVGYY